MSSACFVNLSGRKERAVPNESPNIIVFRLLPLIKTIFRLLKVSKCSEERCRKRDLRALKRIIMGTGVWGHYHSRDFAREEL
jgi:hypothetical protein